MDEALGLLGIAVFAACVIGLAASITWVVVKVSPAEKETPTSSEDAG